MIEFILGSLFGFGTFMLTLYVINYTISNSAKDYSRILTKQFKERFGADSDKK